MMIMERLQIGGMKKILNGISIPQDGKPCSEFPESVLIWRVFNMRRDSVDRNSLFGIFEIVCKFRSFESKQQREHPGAGFDD